VLVVTTVVVTVGATVDVFSETNDTDREDVKVVEAVVVVSGATGAKFRR